MDIRKYQLFKTELCRNWQEMGICRYGKTCRFAHGQEELKCLQRHVKYKTEICKTFHLTGTCSYGVRCNFIHDHQTPFHFNSNNLNLWKNSPVTTSKFDTFFLSFDRRSSSSSTSSSFSIPFL